jgi:uncharacterized lipoprotein YmbA
MSRARLFPMTSWLGCCLLVACGTSPATHYYALQAMVPAASPAGALSAPSNQIVVRLEPVVIPPELDRLALVTRSGPYRVHISDSDRWAAPLEEQIRRTLSDDLSARLPPRLVADPNEPAGNQPRRLLTVAISQFDADATCAVTLRADWTLRAPNADSQRGVEELKSAGVGACAEGIPAAMSVALAELADRLAAVLEPPAGAGATP